MKSTGSAVLMVLGVFWGSLAQARTPDSGFLRWPLPAYKGVVRGLGTPIRTMGSEEVSLNTGMDIPAVEGMEVYAPFDADGARFFLGEEFSIHLTNSKLGQVLVLDHLDPKNLPSFLDGQSEGTELSMNIKSGKIIGYARGEVHLEIREIESGDLLDPQDFFEETSQRDQIPPSFIQLFVKGTDGTFRAVIGGSLGELKNPVEFLLETYDIKGGSGTYVTPQRIRFSSSGKILQSIDLSRMKAKCEVEGETPCQKVRVEQDPEALFFLDPDLPKPAAMIQNYEMKTNERPRYVFRTGPIEIPDGDLRTIQVAILDAGGGRASTSFFFRSESSTTGSLGN